jgi:hypothetical protein
MASWLPNFDIDLANGPARESATTDCEEDRTPILVFNLPQWQELAFQTGRAKPHVS